MQRRVRGHAAAHERTSCRLSLSAAEDTVQALAPEVPLESGGQKEWPRSSLPDLTN